MKNERVRNLTLSAMFLGMGIALPFLTGQVPQIGSMLLPMHIPVFLCSLICPWQWGVSVAVVLPIFRSLVFGVPNMYPEAISIAFEMATYAFVCGLLYSKSKHKCVISLYRSLLISMIVGRVIRCIVQLALLGLKGIPFSFGALFTGIVLKGIPGVILQLIVIPATMLLLRRTKLVPVKRNSKVEM